MRYKVDLKDYLTECEANYIRLLKLFPALAVANGCEIGMLHGTETIVSIQVLEQTPYTTLLKVRQLEGSSSDSGWMQMPGFKVRVYRDAKLAEVVDCEGARRPPPRNLYPNRKMHQQDEKAQWNRFLGEWLSQCMKFGYCPEKLFNSRVSVTQLAAGGGKVKPGEKVI